MPDVEAHITGTGGKIECAVGDEIDEGDTVVIFESMKMEMPVEAEDPGTVKQILCEEGPAGNEGDTLAVLEYRASCVSTSRRTASSGSPSPIRRSATRSTTPSS